MSDKTSTWSDEPPKEPGFYFLRKEYDGWREHFIYWRTARGDWHAGIQAFSEAEIARHYQFGPRIPTAEELVGLYAAAAELAEIKRAWGMRDERGANDVVGV